MLFEIEQNLITACIICYLWLCNSYTHSSIGLIESQELEQRDYEFEWWLGWIQGEFCMLVTSTIFQHYRK